MINANRRVELDQAELIRQLASDLISADEIEALMRMINARYDERLALYRSGIAQWDTNVSITMVLRGVKKG